MTDDSPPDWGALADMWRPHAGYWSWEVDRTLEERDVVRTLAETLARDGRSFFHNPRHRGVGNDPPDCEADALEGGLIGIEVTEFVDGDAIAAARRGDAPPWRYWTTESLVPRIEAIIQRKDGKLGGAKDGPHDSYVLVIYTDEAFELEAVSQHNFQATTFIDRVFLLMSYMPDTQGCPCIELHLEEGSVR